MVYGASGSIQVESLQRGNGKKDIGETAVSKSLDILPDFISANEVTTRHEGFRLVLFVFSWF